MTLTKDLTKHLVALYTIIYNNTLPKANFKKLLKSKEASTPEFFLNYYIPEDVLDDILVDYYKKHKLDKWARSVISGSIYLGAAPTSYYKKWYKKIGRKLK